MQDEAESCKTVNTPSPVFLMHAHKLVTFRCFLGVIFSFIKLNGTDCLIHLLSIQLEFCFDTWVSVQNIKSCTSNVHLSIYYLTYSLYKKNTLFDLHLM